MTQKLQNSLWLILSKNNFGVLTTEFNGFKMNYEICRCFRSGLGSLNVYSLVFVREIDRKSVLLHLLLKMH